MIGPRKSKPRQDSMKLNQSPFRRTLTKADFAAVCVDVASGSTEPIASLAIPPAAAALLFATASSMASGIAGTPIVPGVALAVDYIHASGLECEAQAPLATSPNLSAFLLAKDGVAGLNGRWILIDGIHADQLDCLVQKGLLVQSQGAGMEVSIVIQSLDLSRPDLGEIEFAVDTCRVGSRSSDGDRCRGQQGDDGRKAHGG